MMPILRISVVFLASGVLMTGCLAGRHAQRQALAQKRTFVPLAGLAKPISPAPRAAAVKVRAFRALPPFDVRTFIVRRPGGEFAADYYNGWLTAPHELIRVQAMRYLEASGLFAAVYDSASGTVAPLGLEGLVTELYLDHSGDTPPQSWRCACWCWMSVRPRSPWRRTRRRPRRLHARCPVRRFRVHRALTQVHETLTAALSTCSLNVAGPK